MKLIPIFSLWLASCILSLGAGALNGVAVTHWNGIAVPAWNGSGVSAAAGGGGGPTFLIDEGFDGAGTPSGWYVSGATFDYSASPLIGTESHQLATNTHYSGITGGGVIDHGELYGKFRVNFTTLPSGSFSSVLVLSNSGFTDVFTMVIQPSGALEVGGGSATTDVMTAGTAYWIYWHYAKGSGANGVSEGGFATTETRPISGTKWTGFSTSIHTTNVVQTQTYVTNGAVIVIDQFQISTTAFD